ncbi:MAG: MlaD family protein [candidate division KSB1 bacterium]|nr:MlaD family protein [candidate division KSB1 bacterium]
MARRREAYEVRVGFLIFVALAVLVATVVYVGEQQGFMRARFHLRTLMSRVNGLQEGAPVRLAGVDVGTVTGVEFSPDLDNPKIVVTMEVNRAVKKYIRRDSRAHIGTLGLLGDKFVGITMGSPDQPEVQDWDYIESSDPMDVEKLLDEGVEVFNVLRQSAGKFRDVTETAYRIAYKIDTGQGTLGLLVNDPELYFDLRRLLVLVERMSREIESGEGTLALLFRDPSLYNSLTGLLASAQQLSDSIRTGKGTVGQLVSDRSLYHRADSLVAELSLLTRKLNDERGSLARLSRDDSLYEALVRTLAGLDSLVQDVRRNPKRYIRFSVF